MAPPRRLHLAPRLVLLLMVLLSACISASPPRALIMRDVSFPLRDIRFPSGLRVIVEEDHRAPLVAVFSLVGVGSTSDPPGKEGLAHYVEHLAFRSRPDKEHSIWNLIERTGAGEWNGSTSWDRTIYHEVGPKEALGAMLTLEGVRLLQPVAEIPADVAAVEREVVRNELRQHYETDHGGAAIGWLQAAVFPPGHPYARSTIGSHESLSSITLEDAQRFAKDHYRADNTTMVVVGDIDLQTITRLVEESLPPEVLKGATSHAAAARLEPVAPEPPAPPPDVMTRHEAGVLAPELWMGWSLPRSVDADGYLDRFVTRAAQAKLSGAFFSDSDIDGVSVWLEGGKQAALLVAQVHLRRGAHPERSAEHVRNRIFETWSWSAAQERRFVDQQRSIVTSLVLDAESLVARGVERADLTHFSGDPSMMARGLRTVMGLDAAHVSDFAHKYLTRERARTVLVTPIGGSAPPAEAGGDVGARSDEEPPRFDAQSITRFVRAPGVGQYQRTVLPNGLEVIIGKRPGLPVATVGLSLHGGGSAASPRGADQVARYLSIPKVTSRAFPSEFGGHLHNVYDRDARVWLIEGSSGNVDNMLSLVADWAPAMRVDPAGVAGLRREILPSLAYREMRPEVQANRAFWELLYGTHPYGQAIFAKDLEGISAGEADAWVDRVTVPENAVLAIVGEVEPQQVLASVADTFGRWSQGKGAVAPLPPPALPEVHEPQPHLAVVHRPGATQAEIRYGCLLPPPEKGGARYAVMASLVRNRLWNTLRKTLGATYGFSARAHTSRGGATYLAIEGAVDNGSLGKALSILRQTLGAFEQGKLGPNELDTARWTAARAFGVGFQSNESIVRALLKARNEDRDLATIDGYPAELAKVTAGGLRADFIRCGVAPVLSIVGDEALARAALFEAWPPAAAPSPATPAPASSPSDQPGSAP